MRFRAIAALPVTVLWALPLVAALAAALAGAGGFDSWRAFLNHPPVAGGLLLALWTGTASTLLALVLAMALAGGLWRSRWWPKVPLLAGAALALPHLAFAIGFAFIIMPSGLIARLLVGGNEPPSWTTTQDPLGLSLIAVLVLKETPFLLLMLWSALSQGDSAGRLKAEVGVARSLGHSPGQAFLRVLVPQLLSRSLWPVIIVWVYGVTVVDVALVIGPTQPATAAVTILADLNDADRAINGRGSAGAVAMVVVLVAALASIAAVLRLARPGMRSWLTRGPHPVAKVTAATGRGPIGVSTFLGFTLTFIYLLVLTILVLLSVSPRWPYPSLMGEAWGLAAWARLAVAPLVLSLGLAAATSLTAVAAIMLWLEAQARDRLVLGLAVAALAVPSITLAAGQYRLLLAVNLTGGLAGMFLVHLTPVLAYGFIVLNGPYRSFDRRYAAAARALGASPWRIWREIKLPLLAAPVATTLAVAFSVSLVQFVPAQLAAAGRLATLPMEAVTLASGGNRALTAAAALALTLPALVVFAVAGIVARPRWR